MTTPKIKTVKPDGENGARYYVMEGDETPIPGVTSVLKMKASEGLIHWAANESAEFAVRAVRDPAHSYELKTNPADPDSGSYVMTFVGLCQRMPDTAYDLVKKARFRRNKIAVDKGNDAHDTIERVAFMSLDELRQAYADSVKPVEPKPDEDADVFGLDEPDAPLVPWALRAWGEFVKRFNVRVLYSEVTCYSRNGHVGTCDLIVEMDTPWLDKPRGVVIMDTKTGKGVYPEVSMQLAAYRYSDLIVKPLDEGFNYTDVPPIDGAAVFWPNEDDWSLIPARADEDDYAAFLALLRIFTWDKGAGRTALGKAVVGRKTRKGAAPIDWSADAGA